MTPEEKVLEELKEKISLLFAKIAELKVTEEERAGFEYEKSLYQQKIDDYKKHKRMLEEKYGILSANTALNSK